MHNTCLNSLIILFISLSLYSNMIFAERPVLPQIKDARNTAQLAQSGKLPILIMFGTDECPYCEMLKEEFLIPMIISGDYQDKVILREVHVSTRASIINFSGQKVSIDDFSSQYGVTLFPTMVFVDSKGKPLVEKIIGITTPSLFGGTLDDRINEALTLTSKKIHQ